MARILPTLAGLVIVAAAGIAHGLITHRWSTPPDLRAAAARTGQVALTVGDWEGRPVELEPRDLAVAGVVGGVLRRYVHRKDGREVTVLLVCGPPGPIAVHTPDVCFAGIGYDVVGAPTRATVPAPRPAEFRTALLARQGAILPSYLRIYWGWDGAGTWSAPENPRLAFAPLPVLYKLYVLCPAHGPDDPPGGDAAAAFLREFLSRVDAALFPGPAPTAISSPVRPVRPEISSPLVAPSPLSAERIRL